MNPRNELEQKIATSANDPNSEESISDGSNCSIHTVHSDNGLTIFITTSKTHEERQKAVMAGLNFNYLLNGNHSSSAKAATKEDADFILSHKNIDLRSTVPGLFNQQNAHSINQTVRDLLNEKTRTFFLDGAPEWKYSKITTTAWVVHNSTETLQKVLNFLSEAGINKNDLELGKMKGDSKPILLIRDFSAETLQKLQRITITPTTTPRPK